MYSILWKVVLLAQLILFPNKHFEQTCLEYFWNCSKRIVVL